MITGHAAVSRVALFASIPVLALVTLAAGCATPTTTTPSAAGRTATTQPSVSTTSPRAASGPPAAVPTTTTGPPVVPGQPACTDWPANSPREPLPASFVPVAVLRCVTGDQTIPGKGEWETATLQRADKDLAALIAALRLPPIARSPGMMCPDLVILPPQIALVNAAGKTLFPRLPTGGCGLIQGPVLVAVAALPWQTVSVRLVAQVQSQAEVSSGCTSAYSDPFAQSESYRRAPGAAGYAALPSSLRICVYAAGNGTDGSQLLRGTTVTGPAATALIDGLSSPLRLTVCTLPRAMFAVVTGLSADGPVVYVELGGCDRVYRPESLSGGVLGMSMGQATPAAEATIEAVTSTAAPPGLSATPAIIATPAAGGAVN